VETDEIRHIAAEEAIGILVRQSPAAITPQKIIAFARPLAAWIAGTATSSLAVTAAIDGTPAVTHSHPAGGIPMAQVVNATVDNTTVTLVVATEDDHGNATADSVQWGNDDAAGAVGTYAVSDDTKTLTITLAQAEGTVNVTVTDPTSTGADGNPLSGDVQVVVGPGATEQLQVAATVA
jgi:hypothetical protein